MLSFSYTSTFLLVQVALLGSSESSSAKQYIATSQSDVINGVPLNHDYTDLSTTRDLPSGGRRSAPGCPKNEGGYPWLYHVDAKCYLAGTRGPCKSTFDPFAFWDLRDNSDYGTCYCGCLRRYNDTFEVVTDARNPDKVCFSDRTYFYNYLWIFVNKEQKCFSSYEQGPCKPGEWLVADRMKGKERAWVAKATCEKRTCPAGMIPEYGGGFYFNVNSFDKMQGRNMTCGYYKGSASPTAAITPSECEKRGERYSNLLKRCLPKARGKLLSRVIG